MKEKRDMSLRGAAGERVVIELEDVRRAIA